MPESNQYLQYLKGSKLYYYDGGRLFPCPTRWFNAMDSNARRAAMWSVPRTSSLQVTAPRLSFQTDLVMIRTTSPPYSPFITKLTTAITCTLTQQLIASYFQIIFVNILGLIFVGMNEADYRNSTLYFRALGTPM